MSANYGCPRCSGQLANSAAANVYRCRRCGECVVEAIGETYQRVREFYDRATTRQWRGIR